MEPGELKSLGIDKWPIWTKEQSRFEWTYHGEEQCYIIEGEFKVETDEGTYAVKPGDFVIVHRG